MRTRTASHGRHGRLMRVIHMSSCETSARGDQLGGTHKPRAPWLVPPSEHTRDERACNCPCCAEAASASVVGPGLWSDDPTERVERASGAHIWVATAKAPSIVRCYSYAAPASCSFKSTSRRSAYSALSDATASRSSSARAASLDLSSSGSSTSTSSVSSAAAVW